MSRGEIISAPWTEEQVAALNAFQRCGRFHPFTCEYRGDHYTVDEGVLIATKYGWECPYKHCDYFQMWALAVMADPYWLEEL